MDITRSVNSMYKQDNRPEYKCMNCGEVITDNGNGLDSRRFCSLKCKEEYMK